MPYDIVDAYEDVKLLAQRLDALVDQLVDKKILKKPKEVNQ